MARVAQLVEHATENRSVGGSTPSPGTIFTLDPARGAAARGGTCRTIGNCGDDKCTVTVIPEMWIDPVTPAVIPAAATPDQLNFSCRPLATSVPCVAALT
ncbi:MAG: hypothetical protein RIS52_2497, partial [Pseudomonadota bacterium]